MKASEHLYEFISKYNLKLWPSNYFVPGINCISHLNKKVLEFNYVNTDNYEEVLPSDLINLGVEKYFDFFYCYIGTATRNYTFLEIEDMLLQNFNQRVSKIEDIFLTEWELILNNFELLIQLLYRIDVSESKLKKLLLENQNEDAGKMIAALIIERQIQKIKSTKDQDNQKEDASTEERW